VFRLTDDADPLAPLLARIAAGDHQASRDLYASTYSKLLGVLISILGTKPDAEDALQEL